MKWSVFCVAASAPSARTGRRSPTQAGRPASGPRGPSTAPRGRSCRSPWTPRSSLRTAIPRDGGSHFERMEGGKRGASDSIDVKTVFQVLGLKVALSDFLWAQCAVQTQSETRVVLPPPSGSRGQALPAVPCVDGAGDALWAALAGWSRRGVRMHAASWSRALHVFTSQRF